MSLSDQSPSPFPSLGYGDSAFSPFPPPQPSLPPPSAPPRVPMRFFIGMFALYMLMMLLFAALNSPLYRTIPNWPWFIPACTGGAFVLVTTLFLLIIGRGRTSGLLIIVTAVVTLALSLVTTTVGTGLIFDLRGRVGPLELIVQALTKLATPALDANASTGISALATLAIVPAEHAAILLPVFVLVLVRIIRRPQSAMFLAAICAINFNLVLSIAIGYGEFPLETAPVTQYLLRFVNMSAVHAAWAMIAAGLLFFPVATGRGGTFPRPSIGRYILAFALICTLRLLHDTLQWVHPATNVAVMLLLLAPIYGLGKAAWRSSILIDMAKATPPANDPFAQPPPPPPLRRMLIPWLLIAPLLAAALTYLAYIVPPDLRQSLVALHFVKWLPHTMDAIDRVDDQRSYDAMRKDIDTWNPNLLPPELRDAYAKFLRTIDPYKESKEFRQLSGQSRLSGAVRLGIDGVDENALADAIAIPSPQPALDAVRLVINRYAAARHWPAPSEEAHHWKLTITSVQLSAAAIAKNERNDPLDPYLLVGHLNSDGTVFPLARTDIVSPTLPPAPLDIYSSSRIPRLYLIDRDPIAGGSAPGEMLDFLDLPTNDPGGVLTLRHGTTIRLTVEYSRF
jgi:hypothetical protein